ncbi:RNA-binding domain-containing protein [Novosphingobium clariflavum]|uniref:RNA-binding domain-containing protein n=1 Tax=Novosphingobium clariflavum TaxID=2029884 RepID=A0ABV6S1J8_9SPHN|nr:RNA-binding domain-containing protein [Novosphingobium clariflavum]
MIWEDIYRQIRNGEGSATAFVPAAESIEEIASTVSAFLNTHGGVVFVGVGPGGRILGVSQDLAADELRRSLEEQLRAAITPKALFTLSVDVETDRPIITVEVPQGRDGPYAAFNQYYRRDGAQTLAFDNTTLDQFFRERSIEAQRWERRPSASLDDEDLAPGEIPLLVEDASRTGRFDFSGSTDEMAVLQRLGLTSGGMYTQGADVLFAKSPELRHPQCRVRLILYASDKVGDTFIDDRWIVGPLGQVFYQVVERLSSVVRIQAKFPADNPRREDLPTYSMAALREGVVNALAHRDYSSFSSGVTISVYPSRIEIWNAGQLPPSLKIADLRKNHPSIPTNPDIAFVLYLRGLMDRLGRGTQKIILGSKESGARAPKWESKASGITLTIYSGDLAAIEPLALHPRQAVVLQTLRPGDAIRTSEYMVQAEVSERQARRDLAALEEFGFLEKIGSARATSYRRTEREL